MSAQEEVEAAWQDTARWTRMSLANTAGSGFFSADRTVRDYAERIWSVDPVTVARIRRHDGSD